MCIYLSGSAYTRTLPEGVRELKIILYIIRTNVHVHLSVHTIKETHQKLIHTNTSTRHSSSGYTHLVKILLLRGEENRNEDLSKFVRQTYL